MGKVFRLCALVGLLTTASVCVGNAEEIKYSAKHRLFGNVASIRYSISDTSKTLSIKRGKKEDIYQTIFRGKDTIYIANKKIVPISDGYMNPFDLETKLKEYYSDETNKNNSFAMKIKLDSANAITVDCRYLGDSTFLLLNHDNTLQQMTLGKYSISLIPAYSWWGFNIPRVTLYFNHIAAFVGEIHSTMLKMPSGVHARADSFPQINTNYNIEIKKEPIDTTKNDSTTTQRP